MGVSQRGEETIVFDKATKQVIQLSRELPGKRRWKDGNLYVQGSPDNIRKILETFPTIAEAGLPIVDLYLGAQDQILSNRAAKRSELPPEASAYPFKTIPFAHQRQAFAISRELKSYAYFMEMGTGKTKVNIDVAGHLFLSGYIDVLVVLAPNGVHRQWVDSEIPTHMSDEVPYEAFAYTKKIRVRDKEKIAQVKASKGLKVFTFSIESLSSNKTIKEALEDIAIQYGKRAMLVVDESHMFKDPTANRSEFLQKLRDNFAFRRINTGSPIDGQIESLYGQLLLLDKSILGHSSFTSFKREYCQMEQIYGAPRGAMRITGYQNLQRLGQILDGISMRVLKSDCLDLPEKIYQKVTVEWDPDQRKLYRDLRKQFAAEVEGKEITAPLAITLMTKLRQILGGAVITDKGETVPVPSRKLDALRNIVEQNPKGGIVWVQYLSEAFRVRDELQRMGLRVGLHIGDTDDQERKRITTKGEVDWLVANDSASTGLNLAWWDLAVYYTNSFNSIIRWQSEDRIHRIGQVNRPVYVDLVVPGSVDEVVIQALEKKRMVSDYVWSPEEFLRDVLRLEEDDE